MAHRLIYCFLLALLISVVKCKNCNKEPKCKSTRIHGMKVADCYQRDLRFIPQCVSDSSEVIDLSYNRIRKINKGDLMRYSNLKILYLSDNMVTTISDEAFEEQDELQTLDLTMNSLQKLPAVIFRLPSLKSLYLGQNLNINIVDTIENAKPIASPLTYLDISLLTDEDPIEMPNFGVLPDLTKLNITGNVFDDLRPEHFAGLCKLKYLMNSNVTVYFSSQCDCWNINKWLNERNVQFTAFDCPVQKQFCLDEALNPEDVELYESCREKIKQLELKSNVKKISIISVVVALVVLAIVGVFIYKRKYRKPKATKLKNMKALMINE